MINIYKMVPLDDIATSATALYGSHLYSTSESMVHWPTTGFLPNGLWSTTFSTIGGVYISSLGKSFRVKYRCLRSLTFKLVCYLKKEINKHILPLSTEEHFQGSWGSFSCSWWQQTESSHLHTPPPSSGRPLVPAGRSSCCVNPMPESTQITSCDF